MLCVEDMPLLDRQLKRFVPELWTKLKQYLDIEVTVIGKEIRVGNLRAMMNLSPIIVDNKSAANVRIPGSCGNRVNCRPAATRETASGSVRGRDYLCYSRSGRMLIPEPLGRQVMQRRVEGSPWVRRLRNGVEPI
jgi:hypothetical protein